MLKVGPWKRKRKDSAYFLGDLHGTIISLSLCACIIPLNDSQN